MNVALIIAGGTGARMRQEIPKQFLNVNDKPVVIYTLEAFQSHPDIDKIGVVCVDGWHDILKAYARQYRIDKLDWVVSGGENARIPSAAAYLRRRGDMTERISSWCMTPFGPWYLTKSYQTVLSSAKDLAPQW